MRLRLDRRGQPAGELDTAQRGDGVSLAIRASARFHIPAGYLAVPGQPPERGVHLAEWQRFAAAEVRVVVALEVIPVARLTLEQTEKGQRNCHVISVHHE